MRYKFLGTVTDFWQASLIGQAPPKLKGKVSIVISEPTALAEYPQMARMVATKAALSIRVDALTDSDGKSEPTAPTIGMENRAKLESRLRALEHQGDLSGIRSFAESSSSKKQKKFEMNADTKTYNTAADVVDLVATQRDENLAPAERAVNAVLDVKEEKKRAKEERRRLKKEQIKVEGETNGIKMDVDNAPRVPDVENSDFAKAERKRLKKEAKEAKKAQAAADGVGKEKKKRVKEEEQTGEEQLTEKKKKRKRDDEQTVEEQSGEKKKKKRKE